MVSFPQVSPPESCTPLSPAPYAPHAPPISFFSILPPALYQQTLLLTIFLTIHWNTNWQLTNTTLKECSHCHLPQTDNSRNWKPYYWLHEITTFQNNLYSHWNNREQSNQLHMQTMMSPLNGQPSHIPHHVSEKSLIFLSTATWELPSNPTTLSNNSQGHTPKTTLLLAVKVAFAN